MPPTAAAIAIGISMMKSATTRRHPPGPRISDVPGMIAYVARPMALIAQIVAAAIGAPTNKKATLPLTTLAVNNPAAIGIAVRRLRATSITARRARKVDAESHQIGLRRSALMRYAVKRLPKTTK